MIYFSILFILGLLFEWRVLWHTGERREWVIQSCLIVLGSTMAAMVHWRLNQLFDPLRWINGIFRPLTKWLYQIL